MGNKEDWEKLEKWAENDKAKREAKYNIDFDKVDMEKKTHRFNIFYKFLHFLNKFGKRTLIFVISIVLMIICPFVVSTFGRYNIDAIKTIQQQYGIKVKVVSQNTDDRGNGKYILTFKNNQNIQFSAIKKYGSLIDDYSSNLQKYIFENWNSETKRYFSADESFDSNNFLQYQNYIVLDNNINLDKASDYIIELLKYAENWNDKNKVIHYWQKKNGQFVVPMRIYIKQNEEIIYISQALFQTEDDVRRSIKK